jgi:hypothetical protein
MARAIVQFTPGKPEIIALKFAKGRNYGDRSMSPAVSCSKNSERTNSCEPPRTNSSKRRVGPRRLDAFISRIPVSGVILTQVDTPHR